MASLFGALNTAVSGLTAQSAAFGNISDNIANSQSAGFKGTNTSFADYLSTSTAVTNDSGAVVARPQYQNTIQGTIATSTDPLALAIDGQGFFQVNQMSGSGSTAVVNATPEYTRDGDFTLDSNGYLVNGSQQVLNGWIANPATGTLNATTQAPIKIDKSALPPTATANITLAANLPASPSTATVTSQALVYDAKGTQHTVNLTYTQTAPDAWTVSIDAPTAATPALGTAKIEFGPSATGNPVAAGTLGTLSDTTGSVTTTAYAAGGPATISFTADFGSGAQAVNLNLGNFGSPSGLTQFAGTSYSPSSLKQDGVPPGNYAGVATQSNGNVVVSYDNGASKVVAKIPVIQFTNADALQRQNGQAFTETSESGVGLAKDITTSGATMVAQSVEGSNVDIAAEFTKLIVAQQAYAANSKVITTAADMLTQTIDMKR